MERMIGILNRKWAWVLALIPGANILYLLFWFLTVPGKSCFSCFLPLVAIPPIWLLRWLLPDAQGWLVTHLVVAALSFLVMRAYQGAYRPYFRAPLSMLVPFCILLLALLTSPWWVCLYCV